MIIGMIADTTVAIDTGHTTAGRIGDTSPHHWITTIHTHRPGTTAPIGTPTTITIDQDICPDITTIISIRSIGNGAWNPVGIGHGPTIIGTVDRGLTSRPRRIALGICIEKV